MTTQNGIATSSAGQNETVVMNQACEMNSANRNRVVNMRTNVWPTNV